MRIKVGVLTAAFLFTGILHATTITVNLGASNQNYSLIGTGGSGGYGTYLAQQGTCSAGATLTTCILTGAYTGSTPGYTSGNYTLTTSYNNADNGLAATSNTAVDSPDGGNYFHFDPFMKDVNMDLFLVETGGGVNAVPLVQNGAFLADSYFIGGVAPSCSNLPVGVPCTQGNVGVYNGSIFSGPIVGGVLFNSPIGSSVSAVPEPEWLALGGLIPGALMFMRRRLGLLRSA